MHDAPTDFFAPVYAPASVPSLARLAVSAKALQVRELARLQAPPPFDTGVLQGLVSPDYALAFDQGHEPLASSQGLAWSPELRDATYAMLSGQLAAAAYALTHGIAMNLARGFHHAVYERGAGFCPINGLALVAQQFPQKRIFVIDCDEHGGNGTEEYTRRLPNLFNASIFGTRFGCHGGERSWAFPVLAKQDGYGSYRSALDRIDELLDEHHPDLVLYQAGTDCHIDDPKSRSRLTTRQMLQRDITLFRMLSRHRMPVVINVAGGYQDADIIALLNAHTAMAARHAYRLPPGMG